MSRRRRSLGTAVSFFLLAALSCIVAGCGGDHSGGASGTASAEGKAGGGSGTGESSYLASSSDDFAGDYSVNKSGDDSDDSDDGGSTDLTIADNGDVTGTTPDSDGGTDDLSGVVDSSGDADIDSTGASRTTHTVGLLKRTSTGLLIGTMIETVKVNGAAPITRVVVYRLTKRTSAATRVAAR